jgi:hypothetical protein
VLYTVYPIIQVHNQLVGGPLGSNITLDCMVEASPKPINYWARESGKFIINPLLYILVDFRELQRRRRL